MTMDTALQDHWKELAAALRAHLVRRVEGAAYLKPAELKELIDAARELYWLDLNAASFDKNVDLLLARITASD